MRPSRESGKSEAGFIAIDALVGLTILTSALTLTMVATGTGLKLARQAEKLERARSELQLLAEAANTSGDRAGSIGDLSWTVHVEKPGVGASLCEWRARVGFTGERRAYDLSTLRPCPAPANAG